MARLARLGRSTSGAAPGPATSSPGSWSARASRASACPAMVTSDYINTIPPEQEPWFPGDEALERRIRAYIRWNAMAMVDRVEPPLRRSRRSPLDVRVGRRALRRRLQPLLPRQGRRRRRRPGLLPGSRRAGHLRPRVPRGPAHRGPPRPLPARGRRRRPARATRTRGACPTFWEFPTVSMGLGPLNAVAQARFNRYLLHHEIADTSAVEGVGFVGDGEMDEPEAMAGLSIAAREQLDNLIFVVNCNLQRLDGPVRGNGKIIQELEAIFRGAGWNVIKVIWGRGWDELLARDVDGVLVNKMNSTVDGEFQKYAVERGAYIREHFFGPDPRLQQMVEHLTDDDLRTLPRGGHDYRKLYAAYKMAVEHEGSPTVILAKTVKGWTLGAGIEARNATHQIKKLTADELQGVPRPAAAADPRLRARRRRPAVLAPGHRLARVRVHDGAPPRARRLGARARGAHEARSPMPPPRRAVRRRARRAPARRCRRAPRPRSPGCCATCCAIPTSAPASCRSSPTRRARSVSTRCSASTRSTRRSASATSRSTPSCCSRTARRSNGRILEEGITEAGSMATLTAAGTSYATWGQPMIPFFIFYSMFGFQRVGDLIWAFGDQRGRGLPARRHRRSHHARRRGAAALRRPEPAAGVGRTRTAAAYDPAFAYEMGVIIRDGIERMYGAGARGLLLLPHALQRELLDAGDARGRRGRHRARALPLPRRARDRRRTHRAQILASGTAMLAALDAQQILADELRRRRRRVERDELQAAARGRAEHRALEPAAPHRAGAHAVRHRAAQRQRRADRRGDRLHEGGARPDRALRAAAVRRRSAPTATASPTPGSRCAATSRSTRRASWSRCSHGLAQTEAIKGEVVQEAIARFDIDPDKRRSPPHLDPSIRRSPSIRGRLTVVGGQTGAASMARRSSSFNGSSSRGSSSHSSSSTSSSSSASASRSTSARVPEPSRNRPSSKPCFSSRASRNRRARPFLGTWSPALQDSESSLHR